MAANIDEASYEETIQALRQFASEVMEASRTMTDQANECVENCEEDEASSRSRDQVLNYAQQFQACADTAQSLAQAMAEELERAREAAAKADSI